MVSISSDVIRGYNDTMILFLLKKAPSYGYEISKDIKALSEEKYIIKETTLYSAFTRMEANGYVESYSQEAENGKRNRSPVGEHQNKNAADEGTIQRISDLEQKLKEANETITKLRKHIKGTEYAVKKIANLATSIPPFSSN